MEGIDTDIGGVVHRQASKLSPVFDRQIEQYCICERGI